MTFQVGETVVYPHHGAAVIQEIKTETVDGVEKEFLVLQILQGDLEIEVPAENLDLVGIRDVVDEEGVEQVFSVLRAPYVEEVPNWSRRYKANQEKIATGDIMRVAEVVRDLSRRDTDKGLSAGEKRMLQKARSILGSELALARQTEEETAAAMIDEALGIKTKPKAAVEGEELDETTED